MSITVDDLGTLVNGFLTTLTVSHTVASGAIIVVCSGSWDRTVSSVTFNGDALTSGVARASANGNAYVHYKTDPDVGSYNVVVTFSGSSNNRAIPSSWLGVNTSDAIGDTDSTDGTTSPTLTLTTTNLQCVIDSVVALGDNVLTMDAGQTVIVDTGASLNPSFGASYEMATGESVTVSWTKTGTDGVCHAALALKPYIVPWYTRSSQSALGTRVGSRQEAAQ